VSDNWWEQSPSLRAKRAFDIAGAGTALVVCGPLLGIVSVCLKATGPILFSQPRPGYRGKVFRIYKLRTMREPRPNEDRYRSDASRVTRLGSLLRKTSLDELPELWNVLRGEMSLVGPRPLLVDYLAKYTQTEARRHEVPPGITGWAQVNGRQNIPFSERLRLDVWYVDHRNFALDLLIIARTLGAVFLDSHGAVESAGLDAVDDIGLSADRQRK
jgi:sugar transferase EpsL